MPTATDPGQELSNLVEWLRAIPAEKRPTYQVIARHLDVDPDDADFIEALAAVAGRLADAERLARFLNSEHGDIDEDHVRDIHDAVQTLSRVFRPTGLSTPWSEILQFARPEDQVAFRWFGRTVRKHGTLVRLTDSERDIVLSELQTMLEELEKDSGPVGIERQILRNGIRRVINTLRYFNFFGHEYTSKQLVMVSFQIENIRRSENPNPDLSKTLDRATAVVGSLLLLLGVFTAPDAVMTAIGHYREAFEGKDPWKVLVQSPGTTVAVRTSPIAGSAPPEIATKHE